MSDISSNQVTNGVISLSSVMPLQSNNLREYKSRKHKAEPTNECCRSSNQVTNGVGSISSVMPLGASDNQTA
jgi:hypothetical protein